MSDDSMASATFLAAFPPIQSAIKIGPEGMRIQLDVPESEMGEAVKLLQWREIVVSVTIAPKRAFNRKRDGNGTVSAG